MTPVPLATGSAQSFGSEAIAGLGPELGSVVFQKHSSIKLLEESNPRLVSKVKHSAPKCVSLPIPLALPQPFPRTGHQEEGRSPRDLLDVSTLRLGIAATGRG